MTPATISVLTNGLTCGVTRACEGGTTMTAGLFTLWCGSTPYVPPVPDHGGGGGHAVPNHVGAYAGQTSVPAQVTYPQSNPDLVYIDPNKVMGRRVPVKINFKMGEREVEKIYTIPVNKAEVLIKVMNFVTDYKKKMSVRISNLTRKTHGFRAIYKRGRAFISKRHDFDE